jgi:Amt family ammonium transporter
LKYKFNFDDSLDVVGVHGVSGLFGMLMIGLLATGTANEFGGNGLLMHGGSSLLIKQLIASISVAAFSFTATFILAKFIQGSVGFRSKSDDESVGLDQTYHAETAYDFSSISTR